MKRMPVLFVGHGSPMNAIEENRFSAQWKEFGNMIPRPDAILSVSAHWFVDGTKLSDSPAPETIYDFYGFPSELYDVKYDVQGSPQFAHMVKGMIGNVASIDNSWGIDHGTWSVLRRIYPKANIPVFQLSINESASAYEHYEIGRRLRPLREQGVLILGSGNIVHNLMRVNWNMEGGYSWAEAFNSFVQQNILNEDYEKVVAYSQEGAAALAVPTPDHFFPLLYVLGATEADDKVRIFNDACILGSISMTSYLFQ